MKHFLGFALIAAVASWVIAQEAESPKPQDKVEQLMQRINELEKRVAELEGSHKALSDHVGPPTPKASEANESSEKEIDQPEIYARDLREDPLPYLRKFSLPGTNQAPSLINPKADDVPSNWMPREFNGFRYYIVPLTYGQSSNH